MVLACRSPGKLDFAIDRRYDGMRDMDDVMTEAVTPEFLSRQAKNNMDELRSVRKDLLQMMQLVTANYELTRRVERRQSEMKDDLEIMLKMEISGSFANMQTTMEHSLGRIEGSMADLVDRLAVVEGPSA